ncbi:MAG TPA: bifunctional DNA-formamidopyrimidine glycosylase/DNA-(apurinic or apyrimidinic site) lyase [Vicinamibacterales bacterium]|jgi:formamidopyrimidine-DNA glycosylase|nr:bifunctional DNA-formamidopyrimidine glycosylase/DNA-(apurinic or apyrimidinic site) lyase [Vicinamibacterales bacterium]
MPELPEVEAVRRTLEPAMRGAQFIDIQLNRGDLRQPFPPQFVERLRGQTVAQVARRGKYLIAELSSGDRLIMHLGMSGWFRVESTHVVASKRKLQSLAATREDDLEARHDHVVFTMSSGRTVTFNDPRRFGVMDLVSGDVSGHPSLARMGTEPLSRAFGAAALASRLANRRTAIKIALLDQTVVAGVGNIYASEALHLARISPLRAASTLTTARGFPRAGCQRLAAAIKAVLRRAITRTASKRYRAARFRVYDREGEPCPTPRCRGTIARIEQGGRSTFYCPVCQR